ncbi:ABC transporter permease subunit [Gordonia jinghuaiqii]|uniref:ABC transporter permease n=1 Tax=Gordonia jinghuaiqii TaxID=2758710 RepID=A0A7D7LWE1_9ACTN|nr:ABC transporter permease [Gordonia jinghuaiqii]MCR5978057.1 ABC transporter permease subunit [Gordonia jinghuaiqii]QMT01479.1 ABC transporter permease [Gordonia jinghuaiqii]
MTVIESQSSVVKSFFTKVVRPTTSVRKAGSDAPWHVRLRRMLPPLGAFVIGLALWQLVIELFDIPPYMLPSPRTLVETLWEERTAIWEPTWVTVQESYLAFAVATVTGIAIALVMARWNIAERGFYPYLIVLQTIPIVAIAPLFVVWIGPGQTTNMLVGAMIALFPVAANTLHGLKSTDRNLVQLYSMAGAPPRITLFSLRFPGASPAILTGMRIAAGSAVIGAIVGEFVAGVGGGEGGLGYIITQSAVQLRTPQLFVAVVMASAVSLVLFGFVVLLERLLLSRWHESALPEDE